MPVEKKITVDFGFDCRLLEERRVAARLDWVEQTWNAFGLFSDEFS